jgi:hypothetical protein
MYKKRLFWDSKLADKIEDVLLKFVGWYTDKKYDWNLQKNEDPQQNLTLEESYSYNYVIPQEIPAVVVEEEKVETKPKAKKKQSRKKKAEK